MVKNLILSAGMALWAIAGAAQTISFTNGAVTYSFSAAQAGEMTFDGAKVAVGGRVFDLGEWSRISVDEAAVAPGTVAVTYGASAASVVVAGDVAPYVDVAVSGARVVVSQSELVADNTCGEITYLLAGESADGSFQLNGSYKSTIELQGLTLACSTGAAIDIRNGKRIALSAKTGTVNTVSDGPGSQKGAIDCKGHLELKGHGMLTVSGAQAHAIHSKEYVEIKNLTLKVAAAVKDGINCGQYFLMESGSVEIANIGDDGIQASFKDETDREADDTGAMTIAGGSLTVTVGGDAAAKCLTADGDVVVSGGTLVLTSSAKGKWDSTKSKTKASACIGADGNVDIRGGELTMTATGSGGKGISCDGVFTSTDGKLTIATSGGMLVYSNGSLNHNYTSSADRISSNYKSSAKGIKADGGVVINGGDLHVTTSTNNAEGIESKQELEINGGTVFVKGYDDGINSSKEMRISGGDLTVIAVVGDGLDSNNNLRISGGYIRAFGASSPEMGLDADTESGCTVYITGGTLLAYGGSNTYPTKSGSTQPFVKTSGSVTANSEVSIKSGSHVLATFTIPAEYTGSSSSSGGGWGGPGGGGWGPGGGTGSGSLMISTPQLVSGSSYTIVNGSSSSSATAALTGSGR